ncbi:MAG: hypothetical protein IPM54_16525 [Polyangiaceae bacterium]|nr:hypothetical protein [Polyangiaceae bacterium]
MRDKLFFALFSLFAVGCLVRNAAEPLVRVHAAKDLDCPQDDIRVAEEWGGKYKAVGCGRKAYYRTACDALQCVVHGEGEPFVPWRDRPQDQLDRTVR